MKKVTSENVKKIKARVKRAYKQNGFENATKVAVGAITAYAGCSQERTFTETQLHEIFDAVVNHQ